MADSRWKSPTVVLYGQNMVDVRKGSKSIHLNTFAEWGSASHYAQGVARAMGVPFVDDTHPEDETA